ncbi:MAG: hypothetical protein E7262_00550 [Lachnospiraceae bacterium]|nr:hypothetical protein [Lachnospiraceae bacterium]
MKKSGDVIEIRCKRPNCNRMLLKYCVSVENLSLYMECFELKCDKCKRVLRPKIYTEDMLIEKSEN